MRKFIAIALVSFLILILSIMVHAQDETADCFFELDEENYIELGDQYFLDCAELLIDYGYSYEFWEAYGFWGDFYIYVGEAGEVYYVDESNEWAYWGDVSVPDESNTSVDVEDDSSGDMSLDEIFELAAYDINVYWEMEFAEADYPYSEPDIYYVDSGDVYTDCGSVGDSTGPVYCPADATIYLNFSFMVDQYSRIGDFAVVVVMAHEWGHAVEDQLGYFEKDLPSQTIELTADCLAGAYTNYLMHESENAVLEEGDVDEAATSLFEAGDEEGTPWFDEDAHGTGEQRMDAFQVGVEFGADQCLSGS